MAVARSYFSTYYDQIFANGMKTFQGFFKSKEKEKKHTRQKLGRMNVKTKTKPNDEREEEKKHVRSNLWILICKQVANIKAKPIVQIPIE